MRVFRCWPSDGYEWATTVNLGDHEVFLSFDSKPLRSRWQPISVELVAPDQRHPPPKPADFPWLGSHALVMKPRAREALGEFLEGYGELLSLQCQDTQLWIFHCLTILDALDFHTTDLTRLPSGGIMELISPVFIPNVIEGKALFKIPQMLRSQLFVTDEFVERVSATSLTGLEFRQLWGA
jgi:hypothetical protein